MGLLNKDADTEKQEILEMRKTQSFCMSRNKGGE